MPRQRLSFGEKLKHARIQSGLTQAEIADRMGVSQGAVSNWETDRSRPDKAQVEGIEAILGRLERTGARRPESSRETSADFATWLNETRVVKGLSVSDLAEAAGVSVPTVYNIESGRIENPRKQTVRRLERALEEKVPVNAAAETEEQATIEGVGELVGFNPHIIEEVPAEPGIYVFYDISDRPVYVGESGDIKTRIRGHRDAFWFKEPIVDTAAYVEIKDKQLRQKVETLLIRFLKSNAVLNKQKVRR